MRESKPGRQIDRNGALVGVCFRSAVCDRGVRGKRPPLLTEGGEVGEWGVKGKRGRERERRRGKRGVRKGSTRGEEKKEGRGRLG